MWIMKRLSLIIISLVLLSSCDDFLGTLPDNRTEVNTVDKVAKLLTSAYPDRTYVRWLELSSDNIDDMGEDNPNGGDLLHQQAYWQHSTIGDNESNVNLWQGYYKAIATANTALEAIENMGETKELLPYKGEALMCRAYAHFCLTMIYCLPYHPDYADQYQGIVYMEKPETTLNPKYSRSTLAYCYEMMEKDIVEALPLLNDEAYSVPKYHFNRLAGYAFATRFYINCMKWEKAIECADYVLGNDPAIMLRDWKAVNSLAYSYEPRTMDYIDPVHKFNLMMIPLFSGNGSVFSAWSGSGAKYTHNNRVSKTETYASKRPMGGSYDRWKASTMQNVYVHPPFTWDDNITNKVYMPKWPSQWQVSNPVLGTGYGRSTMVAFTTNECLLNRAEAYIHLKQYDKAAADMNVWNKSMFKVGEGGIVELTRERINEVYGNPESSAYIAEYTTEAPTSRKPLHPHGFTVEEGEQEHFIQCVLYCKRIDSLGEGLRWADVKRYGITVDRFDDSNYIDETTTGFVVGETLPYNDLRRALQLPPDVIASGIEPNPNNEDAPEHPFRNL